jgi:hypothetical protein
LNNKGQFSIIAALLVAVILISTVIVTYSTIRNSPIPDQPQVLSAIDETNFAIKQIFGFTVGYYGSVLKVTGNSSYAKMLALNYLYSGLVNIANMHPEWGTSFKVNESKTELHTYWYTKTSYSTGNLAVTYNLTGLGIYRITYQTSCKLSIQIIKTNSTTQACLNVTKDENEPLINLGKQNFKFYSYKSAKSAWELINPSTDPVAFANGTYLIDIPSGVDPYAYIIQVEDSRGIIVSASSFSRYTCTLAWNSTLYAASVQDATIVVELLQNGTMRWLGQNLQLTTQSKPIPPIPVKAIHVNQTVNSLNREVPFQIEDWASDYKIPLGLTSNASVFSSTNMLVFLVNSKVSKVTIWWNGSDTAKQTPYAYTNQYFKGDNPSAGILKNGIVTLQFGSGFTVTSTVGTSTCTANFMQINTQDSTYGSGQAYAIHHGIVRDIVHTEAEWSNGITGCPNVYSHLVLTLPANATYYTYQLRLMFMNSQLDRTITSLRPIRITPSVSSGQQQTENGTLSGYPTVSSSTGTFYNYSTSTWAHHWSQYISGLRGAGIMFTDDANRMLYVFDRIAGSKTGALRVNSDRSIELLPVIRFQVQFKYPLDVMWYGAVVTFDTTTPIYQVVSGQKTGLWVTVEHPPTITVTTQS